MGAEYLENLAKLAQIANKPAPPPAPQPRPTPEALTRPTYGPGRPLIEPLSRPEVGDAPVAQPAQPRNPTNDPYAIDYFWSWAEEPPEYEREAETVPFPRVVLAATLTPTQVEQVLSQWYADVANWLAQRDQEHARLLTRLLQVAKDALGQVNELGIILSAGERLRAVIEEVEKERTP